MKLYRLLGWLQMSTLETLQELYEASIGNVKLEGICLQPILCKENCSVARYGADGERERRITLVDRGACGS